MGSLSSSDDFKDMESSLKDLQSQIPGLENKMHVPMTIILEKAIEFITALEKRMEHLARQYEHEKRRQEKLKQCLAELKADM